jgi:hypothetical protein
MVLRVAIALISILIPSVQAEQRVYRLNIMKGETKVREVTTTLDHIQYPDYYPLGAGETVQYAESWMCWGRSEAFEPPCSPPTADAAPTIDQTTPDRKPSSSP